MVSSKTVNKITHSRYLSEEELATLTPAEDISEDEEENSEELETEEIAVEETVDKIAPVRLRIKRNPLPELPVLIGAGEAAELALAAEKENTAALPAEPVEPVPAAVEAIEEEPVPVSEPEPEVECAAEEETVPVSEPEPEVEPAVEEETVSVSEPEPEVEPAVEEEAVSVAEPEMQKAGSSEKSRRGKNRKRDYDDDDFGIIQPEFGF